MTSTIIHTHHDNGRLTPRPRPPPPPTPTPTLAPEDPAVLAEKPMPPWRRNRIGALRITFGVVWLIDAWFKWQPSFIKAFTDYLTSAKDGQPQLIKDWINFWVNIVRVDPHVFAHLVAIGETAVALGLILGAFSNLTYLVSGLLTAVIWTTAEGFGGPYVLGSTDIGAGIMYPIVFAGLFLASAGLHLGLDSKLRTKLNRFRWTTST